MTEQGAQLIITAENGGGSLFNSGTPSMHNKSGALKKKMAVGGTSMKLDPLE